MSGKFYAVLIGINYYGTPSQLSGCVADVNNVRKYIESFRSVNEGIMLIDIPNDPQHKHPFSPTRDNIIKSLFAAVSKCKSGDMLFIHYSGHGSNTLDKNGDEKDGRDETICPVDGRNITDDELFNIIVRNLPAGVKLRVVSDSCHSGSVLDLPYRFDDLHQAPIVENQNKVNADVVMISGCKDSQFSMDAYINGKNTGALTWSFIEALRYLKTSKRPCTWKNLIGGMRYELLRRGFDQVPQLSFGREDQVNALVDIY